MSLYKIITIFFLKYFIMLSVSKEEIYYGIAGLISKTMDIDVFEIKPWKRITTDLGIH